MITLRSALRTTLAVQMCNGNRPVMNSAPTVGVPLKVVADGSCGLAVAVGAAATSSAAAADATSPRANLTPSW